MTNLALYYTSIEAQLVQSTWCTTTLGQIAIFQEKKNLFLRFDFNCMKIHLKLNFHWPQTVTELLDLLDAKIKTNIHLISINTFLEHTSMQLAKMF